MTLIYVDLLGFKKCLLTEGQEGARDLLRTFEFGIRSALREEADGVEVRGGIFADAAALLLPAAEVAVRVGRALFFRAFRLPRRPGDRRLWLRGVIQEAEPGIELVTTTEVSLGGAGIPSAQWSDPLLDAICAEQAGAKGMRLFIERDLVTEPLRDSLRVPIGDRTLSPLRRLSNSPYPGALDAYDDVLWMIPPDVDDMRHVRRITSDRLRWAAGSEDNDEFLHAAATQLLLEETCAIAGSIFDLQSLPHPIWA